MSNMSPGPCVISTASERSSGYGTSFTPKTAMAAEAAQKLSSPEASGDTRLGLAPQNPLGHSYWCPFNSQYLFFERAE